MLTLLKNFLRYLFPWLLLLLQLFLAGCDDQVSQGMSDLFPSLLVGHDSVARCPPSSASAALLACLLLEESSTDLLVEHPDDRLDDVCLIFASRGIDIPLEVHLDCDSEPAVSNIVVGTAVASTNNVVWSRLGDDIAAIVTKRTIHVVVTASSVIDVDVVVHVVKTFEIVSIHDVCGGVDNGSR